MNKKVVFISIILMLTAFSCKHPEDEIIVAVDRANSVLRQHEWHLQQFTIDVRNEEIPPPLLFNSADSLVRAGRYDLRDMVFEEDEMQTYRVHFTDEGKVSTSGGQLDLLAENETKYFVYNDRSVRISSEEKLNYYYYYDREARTLSLTVDEERASKLIRKINDKLVDRVATRSPSNLGNFVSSLLFNNKALQKIINDALVDAIAGRLEFINEIDPDQASQLLAEEILNALQQIDWEEKLTELIRNELEGIQNIDVDEVSEAIAARVADYINERLSVSRINDLIFPFIDYLATNPDSSAEAIATLIVNVFSELFDEDLLKTILAEAWRSFTKLDEEKVGVIADTLTYVVQDIWVNQENIAGIILPFTEKIEETPLLQLGALATETTEAIKTLVDFINEKFPDLELSPDYDNLQSTIRLAYIGLKPIIATIGAEQAARDVADIVLSQFLNAENIRGAFIAAIQFLQSIDPEVAGTKLTEWLVNLEIDVTDDLIIFLRNYLSPILDNLNPEATSLKIAVAISNFISEQVTPERIQMIIRPVLEAFTKVNVEKVAVFIAQQILALDIIKDNINEESIKEILLPVLESVKETNVEQLSQNLINAIVNSGIFEDVITENRVSAIISILIYKATWDNVLIANNFEQATILLQHE